MRKRFIYQVVFLTFFLCWSTKSFAADSSDPNRNSKYLDAVRTFADNVLRYGRDTYGPKHTPLFVDGLNIHTREPVKWRYRGEVWVLSNLASQQNLFRTFDGLSRLTGVPEYRQAAMNAIEYAFENLRSDNGLLYWGGHIAYDALSDEACRFEWSNFHELKYHFPYYELMWEVNPEATHTFIESFWSAHIMDWSNLAMNRHGLMTGNFSKPWNHEYKDGPVFFISQGLSFCNTGSDLFYAGSMLYNLSGRKEPLVWSKRLAHRYIETRNPKIGISGTQYTRLKEDRAQLQFGDDFKDNLVLEGTLFPGSFISLATVVRWWICQLMLGDLLGPDGKEYSQWSLDELGAWGKAAYRKSDNSFIPMLIDGTSLEGYVFTKDGYFGREGTIVKPMPAPLITLWAYALAYRVTEDEFMWKMARDIARGHKLGDIGKTATDEQYLETTTECSCPFTLLGFLELYKKTAKKPFLEMASKIGDNIVVDRFHEGFFVPRKDCIYTKFNHVEPLVLLHLHEALSKKSSHVPKVWPNWSVFGFQYDGHERGTDLIVIYSQTKATKLIRLLHEAAWDGDVNKIRTLISKGVNVNSVDRLDPVVFQRIAGISDVPELAIKLYLTCSTTALHYASEEGHLDAAELLIANGANINVKGMADDTPLHNGIKAGHRDIAELLVSKGADINAKNNEGQTPIDIAISRNRSEVIKLLISKGADVSIHIAARFGALAKVKSLIEKGKDIEEKDISGRIALHYAAENGHKDIVELLIANGANVNARDKDGDTPAHIALGENKISMLALLIEKGANLDSIHLSARKGDLGRVKSFIEKGTDVNEADSYGATPLHYAALCGSKEVVEFLVAKGANVNAKDKVKITPLHRAAFSGEKDVVELLVDNGADINARARWDYTPVFYAAWSGIIEVVGFLVEKGADVNAKDVWGWTPLHYMAQNNLRYMVEFLIAKGADVNVEDNWYETPLQVAEDKGHTEIVELLRKHMRIHDVAVTNVSRPYSCNKGDVISVEISVENRGGFDESFDVELTDLTDGRKIKRKTMILSGKDRSASDADKIFTGDPDATSRLGQSVVLGKNINGDGYGDILIGAPYYKEIQGRVYIYYGGPNASFDAPDLILTGEDDNNYFGHDIEVADFNNDGYTDMAITALGYNSFQGRAYIYYGGPCFDATADKIFDGEPGTAGRFGRRMAAGDINNDGCAELLVCADELNENRGRVYLYYGAPGTDMDTTYDLVFDGENPDDLFGKAALALGKDVDGDGFGDILIGTRVYPKGQNDGRAYLYWGAEGTSMDNVCDLIFNNQSAGEQYASIDVFDIDNDGFADIIIGAQGYDCSRGRVYLHWGSERTSMDTTPDKYFTGEHVTDLFGSEGIICGYVNSDDYGDILVPAVSYGKSKGQVYLFYGNTKSKMDVSYDVVFTGEYDNDRFASDVAVGDINYDNFADVLIGARLYKSESCQGRAYLYFSGSFEQSTSITFKWDTTNASPGKHTLKVKIPPVPGEQNTEDNTKTVTIEIKEPPK